MLNLSNRHAHLYFPGSLGRQHPLLCRHNRIGWRIVQGRESLLLLEGIEAVHTRPRKTEVEEVRMKWAVKGECTERCLHCTRQTRSLSAIQA